MTIGAVMKSFFLFFTLGLLAVGCQKKMESESLSWTPGVSSEVLKKIDAQEWSTQSKESTLDKYTVLQSQQSFMGIPIEDTFVKKVYSNLNNKKTIERAEARIKALPELSLVRGLSFDPKQIIDALKKKSPDFQKIEIIAEATVLKELQGALRPMYKISFFDKRGQPWTLFANLKNQLVDVRQEGSHFASTVDVETVIFPMGPKLSDLASILLEKLNIEPTLSNSLVIVTSEADQKISSLALPLKFDPKDVRFDQVQSFFFLNRSLEWMKQMIGMTFSRQLEVAVHVGFPEKTNSAFYFQNKIRLGAGDDVAYAKIAQDPSIITHESFHYLIDHIAGLPYEGEGGSLNEGFSDFLTATALENPKLAETAYLKGPFKRTVEINRKLSEKNGGLYHDSLIISGLFWEISQKVGREATLKLSIAALRSLNKYSDFNDFNAKLIQILEKENIDFLTKAQIDLIRSIMTERGFHVG